MSICSYEPCSKETRRLTKGLCPTCYARYQRNGTPEHIRPNRSFGLTECANSDCKSAISPFIKGLCRACYQRQYKNGTVERQKVRRLCERPGCDDVVHSHGLCQRHMMRVRRHGSAEAGRPVDWGQRSKHPMYEAWQGMRRVASLKGGTDPRWGDFWAFVEDVGERPVEGSRLYRIDTSKPYSKENCEWRAPILDVGTLASKAERQRVWRMKRPHLSRQNDRRKLYGLQPGDYDRMLAEQNGVCAICGSLETSVDPRSSEPFSLAVDHNKETGKVRGLLCQGCNTGIGGLKHSTDNLRAAIAYLDRHIPDA